MKKPPTLRDPKGRIVLTGKLPHTNALGQKRTIEALDAQIRDLEQILVEISKPRGKSSEPHVEHTREELRTELIRAARRMLPKAIRNAKGGKPALLRLLYRIAEPKSRS